MAGPEYGDSAARGDIDCRGTQTVTLHSPEQRDICATAYSTTFWIDIEDAWMGGNGFGLTLPSGSVTRMVCCLVMEPSEGGACSVTWGD